MTEKYLLLYRRLDEVEWKQFSFSEILTVGTSTQNSLSIPGGKLSGFHFEIRENPTGIYLKDVDAEAGETFVNGQPIPAHRPLALGLNQVFVAGEFEFQVVLKAEDDPEDPSTLHQILSTIKSFGIWKTGLIVAAVVAITFAGALIIYNQVVKKPVDLVATAIVEEAVEAVEVIATLVPTELFELSSTVVVDAVDGFVTAPGMGNFELQELLVDVGNMDVSDLMEFSMNPEQIMGMATTITGENVGYVYSYSGMEIDGKIITTGMDIVEAPQTEEVDGVEIPAWGDEDIPLEIAWQPVLHFLEDGTDKTVVLLQPTIYGATEDEQIYRVDGIYQKKDSETQYSAIARFGADGGLLDILTFGEVGNERQTPYKVNFQQGDQFSPYDMEFKHDPEATQEMALGVAGDSLPLGWSQLLQLAIGGSSYESYQFGIGVFEKHKGISLTLGPDGIFWTTNESPDGKFVAGVAVEDLDGNLFVGYIPVLVNP